MKLSCAALFLFPVVAHAVPADAEGDARVAAAVVKVNETLSGAVKARVDWASFDAAAMGTEYSVRDIGSGCTAAVEAVADAAQKAAAVDGQIDVSSLKGISIVCRLDSRDAKVRALLSKTPGKKRGDSSDVLLAAIGSRGAGPELKRDGATLNVGLMFETANVGSNVTDFLFAPLKAARQAALGHDQAMEVGKAAVARLQKACGAKVGLRADASFDTHPVEGTQLLSQLQVIWRLASDAKALAEACQDPKTKARATKVRAIALSWAEGKSPSPGEVVGHDGCLRRLAGDTVEVKCTSDAVVTNLDAEITGGPGSTKSDPAFKRLFGGK